MSQSTVDKIAAVTTSADGSVDLDTAKPSKVAPTHYFVISDQDGFAGEPIPAVGQDIQALFEDEVRKMYPYEGDRDGNETTIFLTSERLYRIPAALMHTSPEEIQAGEYVSDIFSTEDHLELSDYEVYQADYVTRPDTAMNGGDHTHCWDVRNTVSSGAGLQTTYWCDFPGCYVRKTIDSGASHPSTGAQVISVVFDTLPSAAEKIHDEQFQKTYQLCPDGPTNTDEFTAGSEEQAIKKAKEMIAYNSESYREDEKFDLDELDAEGDSVRTVWSADMRDIPLQGD